MNLLAELLALITGVCITDTANNSQMFDLLGANAIVHVLKRKKKPAAVFIMLKLEE